MNKLIRLVPLILLFLIVTGLNAQVNNITQATGPFATIQAAINDAATTSGDVLQVSDGTYNENVTVSKEVTIQSINGAASTTISASSGNAVVIAAANVTIDGFTITNPSGTGGIASTGYGGLQIINNTFTDIGTSSLSGPTQGVAIGMNGATDIDDVNISNNVFSNIAGGENIALTGAAAKSNNGSGSAISVGWSTANYGVTNLVISGNTISNISASTADWADGGKGAYGILVNVGYTGTGQVSGAQITDNDISSLEGHWVHGIGLEGDTPNAVLTGNSFSSFTSTKTYDNYALFFEGNPAIGTVSFTDNNVNTARGLGIHNDLLGTLTTEQVDAVNNWWGDASGPSGTDLTGSGATFGTNDSDASIVNHVIYSPWVGNDLEAPHDANNPWTFNIDDSNPDALADVLSSPYLLDGDTIVADGGTYTAVTINSEITLQGTNGATIQNGSPALTVAANNVTIDGFTFAYDSPDYAIYVDGDYSGIVVKNCTFNNTDGGGVNPGYGIDNATATTGLYYVDARENNDWGDPSGPYNATSNPSGLGVTVTDYVIYDAINLVSPINSVTGVSIKPTVEWENKGAGGYNIQIATSSDFVNDLLVEHSVGAGINSYIFTGYFHSEIPLANNTQYYWRVIAEYGGIEDTSSAYYFTTVSNVNISLWNPGDGIELYAYDPAQFTWSLNQATGSLKFYLQLFEQGIAPDYVQIASFEITNAQNLGGNTAYYFENINDLYRTVNGLNGGSSYYWYVCAYYDDGDTPNVLDQADRIVKYSPLYHFTTKGGAVKAYPSWPVGGYTIYNLEPTFYWYTMQYEPSATFEVIYSTDNTVGGSGELTVGTTTVSAGSNTYVPVGTVLDPSTTYYWQVKTTYGLEVKYSSVATFTTYDAPGLVPTAATPSYPTGGLEIYTTAPTFYWYIEGVNVDVNFTVELSTDGGSTWPLTFGPTTDTYINGSGLTPGQSYTWRVKSSKTGYADVYSANAEFSVTGGLSSYPVANWPVGNPTVYSATPTLSWYMEGSTLGWTHYKVVWSKKDKTPAEWMTQVLANDSIYVTADMNETYYTFTSPLDYGEKYYWAVTAHDHPSGPYSDFAEGSFTVAGNNANIIQLNPANNIVITTKSPTFTWYLSGSLLGVTHYRVTYSKTELFNAFVETVVSTTTSANVNAPLEEGATYWWYVELSYDGGSTWENPTSTWKFTVDPGSNAVVPFVGSPANGVTISSNEPVLSWYLPAQSSSALSYDVELANNPEFTNSSVYDNVNALNKAVETLNDGEYFWRVRSKVNSDGSESNSISDYSSTAKFKIGSVTDVKNENEVPLTFNIDQNYPNPFNPNTTIKYAVPKASYVTIKVYNMLGQEVKTLVNKEVTPGRFSVVWNGDNNYGSKVASGTYIYRIMAGDFIQAKKMILLK